MSESKFTAGPWDWQKFGEHYFLTGQYGMRPIVLSLGRARNGRAELKLLKEGLLVPFTPDHPDARLISAAPEMFDALQRIVARIQGGEAGLGGLIRVVNGCEREARAALAKAQGKGEAS